MSERIESSDQGSTGTDAGSTDIRPARTAAQQRDQMGDSQDPEVLAAQIEATRDDLAETLDAIADKVSPKKVAARSRKQVTDTVKEKAAQAKEVVAEKTASAKEAVAERRASSSTTETRVVAPASGHPVGADGIASTGSTYGVTGSSTTGASSAGTSRSGASSFGAQLSQGYSTYVAPGGQVRKEVLGGGAAALVALLLAALKRRRSNKRSLRLK